MGAITCPVLLVQGDDDPFGTARQLDAIEGQVTGPTQRLLLPGVGHAPHVEAPDATLAAVTGFVRSVSRSWPDRAGWD
ncbi:MAG: alpha/beta hydrolase [Actinobacteria bacterium]|nr:alpha/beta hydrolase [Actinomycetota bacterium]